MTGGFASHVKSFYFQNQASMAALCNVTEQCSGTSILSILSFSTQASLIHFLLFLNLRFGLIAGKVLKELALLYLEGPVKILNYNST